MPKVCDAWREELTFVETYAQVVLFETFEDSVEGCFMFCICFFRSLRYRLGKQELLEFIGVLTQWYVGKWLVPT